MGEGSRVHYSTYPNNGRNTPCNALAKLTCASKFYIAINMRVGKPLTVETP